MTTRGSKSRIILDEKFIEFVRTVISYEKDTGIFRWIDSRNNRVQIGSIAGYIHNGYTTIEINGFPIKAHRLAYAMVNGSLDVGVEIDHINGVKSDNRISNLRIASISQNECNKAIQKNNTTGFKGVYFRSESPNWRAIITINKHRHHIGYFETKELAAEAIEIKRKELHGEFCNHGEFKR